MIYFILSALIVIFISFLVGTIAISILNIKKKYISFASPIGFLILIGLLQIGYFFIFNFGTQISIFNFGLEPKYYVYYTLFIFTIIIIISCFRYKDIVQSLKTLYKNRYKYLLGLLISLVVLFIFSKTEFNFRMDDLNFYGEYIPNRITSQSEYLFSYSYQAIFIFISVLLKISHYFSYLGIYTDFYPVAFVVWVPAIFIIYYLSLTIVDFVDYLKDKIGNKKIVYFLWIIIIGIVFLEPWFLTHPHFNSVLRKLPIIYILYFLEEDSAGKFSNKRTLLLFLLFGASFGISSTGFFLDMIILYCYFIYSMMTNKKGYMFNISIMAIVPVFFACSYMSTLRIPVFILYSFIIIAKIFKFDELIESFLNKLRCFILFGVPLIFFSLIYVFPVFSKNYIQLYTGNRTFFMPINNFDMVGDFLNFNFDGLISYFNILLWGVITIYLLREREDKTWFYWLFCSLVITFMNPFVFTFVATTLTSVAYYRITDIIFNPIFLSAVLVTFYCSKNKLWRIFGITVFGVLFIIRILLFDMPVLNVDANFNNIYHTKNNEIELIEKLQNDYLKYENKNIFKIASHIYGIQLFSNIKIENLLEDRFSYEKLEKGDEFEQIFYRRQPGFEDIDVNYNHACSLAFEKQADYVILDAQYNWELQEGLWPCSELLFEEGNYRVLKMNYDYWEWNILQGYTEKYEFSEEK